MSYPTQKEVVEPLLLTLYLLGGDDHAMSSSDTYEPLAVYFDLTEDDRKKSRHDVLGDNRSESFWANRVQWARRHLNDIGALDTSLGRGIWKLSPSGTQQAESLLNKYNKNHFLTSIKEQFPEEVSTRKVLKEGATRTVSVNAYERNPKARQECIEHFGIKCVVCNVSLEDIYGEAAKGLIHVHHLIPLSQIGVEYTVNPKSDLRPVCPNCHAVIHRKAPSYTIEEMQAMLRPGA